MVNELFEIIFLFKKKEDQSNNKVFTLNQIVIRLIFYPESDTRRRNPVLVGSTEINHC